MLRIAIWAYTIERSINRREFFFHTTDNNGVCTLERYLSKYAREIELEISKKLRSNVPLPYYMQIMNLHL